MTNDDLIDCKNMAELEFNCLLEGPNAYEEFKKIATEFYKSDSKYAFVGLTLSDEPAEDRVSFLAKFWPVEDGKRHHYLKTLPQYFNAQEAGIKNFEVRFNDRNYQVGDILHLQELVPPDIYTGRELDREVVYVLDDPTYCKDGFVVLGTKEIR